MMKIVLSLVILFAPAGAQRTPRGRTPPVKTRHAGPEHAAVKPRVDEKPRAHQSPRSCDPLEWDAGFGTCDTYGLGGFNAPRCATDCDECGCASDICSAECCQSVAFGYGNCDTYRPGQENEDNCDAHCNDQCGCASDVCMQCKRAGSVTLMSVRSVIPAGNFFSNHCAKDAVAYMSAANAIAGGAIEGVVLESAAQIMASNGLVNFAGECIGGSGITCATVITGLITAAFCAYFFTSDAAITTGGDFFLPEGCELGDITGSDDLYITIGEDGENVWPGNNDYYVIDAGETVYPEVTVSDTPTFCLWEYDWFGGSWGDDLLGCFETWNFLPIGEVEVDIASANTGAIYQIILDVTE